MYPMEESMDPVNEWSTVGGADTDAIRAIASHQNLPDRGAANFPEAYLPTPAAIERFVQRKGTPSQ